MPKIWYPCLFMVPWQMIVTTILQTLGQGTLQSNSVFFLLPTIITFVIHGVIIPISMINRSKKCKKFVLKKVLIPFIVCRNLKWTLEKYTNKHINFIQLPRSKWAWTKLYFFDDIWALYFVLFCFLCGTNSYQFLSFF